MWCGTWGPQRPASLAAGRAAHPARARPLLRVSAGRQRAALLLKLLLLLLVELLLLRLALLHRCHHHPWAGCHER